MLSQETQGMLPQESMREAAMGNERCCNGKTGGMPCQENIRDAMMVKTRDAATGKHEGSRNGKHKGCCDGKIKGALQSAGKVGANR